MHFIKHSNPAQEFLHHEVALMLIFPWRIQKHRPQHCFTHDHTCDEITAYSKITHYNIISPHSCSVSHVMYYVNYNAMHFVSYERWKALSVKALIMSLLVCMASCLGETGWCHICPPTPVVHSKQSMFYIKIRRKFFCPDRLSGIVVICFYLWWFKKIFLSHDLFWMMNKRVILCLTSLYNSNSREIVCKHAL